MTIELASSSSSLNKHSKRRGCPLQFEPGMSDEHERVCTLQLKLGGASTVHFKEAPMQALYPCPGWQLPASARISHAD